MVIALFGHASDVTLMSLAASVILNMFFQQHTRTTGDRAAVTGGCERCCELVQGRQVHPEQQSCRAAQGSKHDARCECAGCGGGCGEHHCFSDALSAQFSNSAQACLPPNGQRHACTATGAGPAGARACHYNHSTAQNRAAARTNQRRSIRSDGLASQTPGRQPLDRSLPSEVSVASFTHSCLVLCGWPCSRLVLFAHTCAKPADGFAAAFSCRSLSVSIWQD